MTRFQCLRCIHLDIEFPDKAICTGCYNPNAIDNSVRGMDCVYYIKQEG